MNGKTQTDLKWHENKRKWRAFIYEEKDSF